MRSYAQYCPVAKASEILGDRWTLLIVREMLGGASGFNELQRGLPGISRSVLTDRMRALERAEVIERRTGPKGRTLEYRLTPAGHWFTWSAFAPASRSAQQRRTAASRLASPHRVRIADSGDAGTAPQSPQPPRLHPPAS